MVFVTCLCARPAASKHAVEGMAKSLRQELAPWNIHVCNINPGFMK
jgi:NAD(P)-dependent dehydrogenase (short-subunit alcohol dehydrogenase family)